MSFGERLRSLRMEKKLTLREFGKELEMSFSALGKYERNENQPDFETLEKIANYFDVTIDYLLGRSDIRTHDEYVYLSDVQHLGDKIKNAPPEIRGIATNIIDKVYLILTHQLKEEDINYLKVIKGILHHLWIITLSYKDSKSISLVAEENKLPYIDDYLSSKNEINKLLDLLIKNYVAEFEERQTPLQPNPNSEGGPQ